MHELSIVEAIVDQVEKEVQRSGHAGRVARLDLIIGRLSGVCVDSIRFAFELLAPGTILERTEVRIEEPRAECVCRSCGRRTEIEELVVDCPECGSADISIEGGRDLLLQTIDLEE
jgi:hydrogenase nickel incorporation protein HypA/HybF